MIKGNLYKALRKNTMLNNTKLQNLVQQAAYLGENNIEGDIVECGVWRGGSAAFMAQTLIENSDKRTLRLFDSFDDICEPSSIDGALAIKQVGGIHNAQGRLQPVKGFYKAHGVGGPGNRKEVFTLLTETVGYPKELVKIYKGWFQNTLPKYSERIDKIALLFLDCDLYASISICLDFLYDKVVSNGIVMVDDYHSYDGCRAAVDALFKAKNIPANLVTVGSTGCVYWNKP